MLRHQVVSIERNSAVASVSTHDDAILLPRTGRSSASHNHTTARCSMHGCVRGRANTPSTQAQSAPNAKRLVCRARAGAALSRVNASLVCAVSRLQLGRRSLAADGLPALLLPRRGGRRRALRPCQGWTAAACAICKDNTASVWGQGRHSHARRRREHTGAKSTAAMGFYNLASKSQPVQPGIVLQPRHGPAALRGLPEPEHGRRDVSGQSCTPSLLLLHAFAFCPACASSCEFARTVRESAMGDVQLHDDRRGTRVFVALSHARLGGRRFVCGQSGLWRSAASTYRVFSALSVVDNS